MKKVILIVTFVVLLVTIAGTAQAAKKWYNATITYAGTMTHAGDALFFSADSTTEAWTGSRWFIVSGDQFKVQLAVALTAYSMGAPVLLLLEETDFDEWSPCFGIFAAPQQ